MSERAFATRALIEGFYGVYYTHPERLSLLHFLGEHGFNGYIYGPKNDRHHRRRWRQAYPGSAMAQFAEAVQVAGEQGIEFTYTVGPGIDIAYGSDEDFAALTAKLESFLELGVCSFGLLLDDIRRVFANPADAQRYETLADAQADLCNRVLGWLRERDDATSLMMCPTDYHGAPPFPASLRRLGERLHPDIDVFYTGVEVCSPTIGASETRAFADALGRRPVIWDNYPVNDVAMTGELHIGPVRGRAAALTETVKGFAVNPMNQAEASRVPLATFGDYLRDPAGYEPESSWQRALCEVAGESSEALELVANTSLYSCLTPEDAPLLEERSDAAGRALQAGLTRDPAVEELYDYLSELDEACYELRYRMSNLALRNELLPWLEQLEQWTWLGRWSIDALRQLQEKGEADAPLLRRIDEYLGLVAGHHKRIAGDHLRPIGRLALERAGERETVG